jgi:gliding motility-associated-like protein
MKQLYILFSLIFCFFFCDIKITKAQAGCNIPAIRAAFAAPGHYTELTGVSGQPCSMYFVNTTSQDADLSEQEAQTLGAHMAVMNTAAENSAVSSALNAANFTGNIWIGYKRTSTGASTFYAMDGTTPSFTPGAATAGFYQNWASGEPNNYQYNSCGPGCGPTVVGVPPFAVTTPCADVFKCANGEQCTQIYSNAGWNDLPCNSSSISIVEVNLCPVTTITPSNTLVCGGGTVSLPTATLLGSAPYTYSWTSSPAGFTSTSANPSVSPSVNTTYSVNAVDRYGCTSSASVTIQVVPVNATVTSVVMATCTSTCNGTATVTGSGGTGSGAFTYSWSTTPVQTTAIATGLCPGTYTCTINKGSCVGSGTEMVTNGDFAAGNTGFTSSYTYAAPAGTGTLQNTGIYSIVTGNASTVHGSFSGLPHSGSTQMAVNGGQTANTKVWCQTINVTKNTDYEFSSWVSTLNATSPAMLQFSFNGVNAGSAFPAPSATGSWSQFFSSWNSGVSTSANICVVNQNTTSGGNDFALDDISFKLCLPACQDTAIVVITAPSVTVAPITPAVICANGNASLTAVPSGGVGPYSYAWLPSGTGNTASVTVSPSGNANYTVNVTDKNNCAAAPVVGVVTVNTSLNVTVNSASLCFGETASLTAGGATTYTWAPATGLSATTGANVICTPPSNLTYTVTGVSGGCVGSAISTVTINPTPDSHAGVDITICSGATGTIGAPSTPTYLYSWSPATGLSDATAANPTVTKTNYTGSPVAYTYTITTSPAGCYSTDEVVVTVNPALDPTFNFSQITYCKAVGSIDPTPAITTTGGVFSFSPTGLIINTSNGLVDLNNSTIGTYTVTYSFAGACPSSSTQVITITNTPDAQFSYGTYCKNVTPNPVSLFPVGSSAGAFTASSPSLVFVAGSVTPGEIDLVASTAGNYTITNTIAAGNGCAAAVATNTITINAIPNTAVADQTICVGGSTTLAAMGATTYIWSDNSTLSTLTVSPNVNTIYSVTGTANGCSSTASPTVIVNQLPTSTFTVTPVCAGFGSNIGYTGNAASADLYNWNFGGGTIISGSGQGPYSVSWPTSGSPNVTLDVTVGICLSTTTTVSVTVSTMPVVIVNSETICAGQSATLTASGATSYTWSPGLPGVSQVVSPALNSSYTVSGTTGGCISSAVAAVKVNPNPVVTINAPASICFGASAILTAGGGGTYSWSTGATVATITVTPTVVTSYTVTATTLGCTGSKTNTIGINPIPTIIVNPETICAGDSKQFTATGSAVSTYSWSDGTSKNATILSPKVTTTYSVIGTTNAGCPGVGTFTVTVNLLPKVTVNDVSICKGLDAILTVSGAVSYRWSNNSTGNRLIINSAPVGINDYIVSGTDANNCTATDTATVNVYKKPGAQFIASPNPAGMFDPVVRFNDQSTPDVNYWYWSFGDGDILDNNTQSPTHTYPGDTATYNALLIVGNAGQCYDSITHKVLVGPEYTFYVPNAFTPDGDGVNEVFYCLGSGILEFDLKIFDRWGNFIFTSDDIQKGWDGKVNDYIDFSQQDVYVWKVAVVDLFKIKHNYTGTITVIRGK